MKKWNVFATVTAGKYIGEVEAETQEEAIEKGSKLGRALYVSVCHQCSDQIDDPSITEINAEEAQ